jgi:predicted nuclease of predicted toxin-antitoxin system
LKFLIDECLTVELVEEAHAAAFEAYHIVQVGKAGWKDWNIASFAEQQDLTIVTNNAADFLKIYSRRQVHPGLVIIIPSVPVKIQRELFRVALDAIGNVTDLVNKVLEVDIAENRTSATLYDLPLS